MGFRILHPGGFLEFSSIFSVNYTENTKHIDFG